MTETGGANNNGAVFNLVPPSVPGQPWKENLPFGFESPIYRYGPSGDIAEGPAGVLYGATPTGTDYGAVFSVSPPTAPNGPWTQDLLHVFEGGIDGAAPNGVLSSPDGTLYGTTSEGGGTLNGGIVFQLAPPTKAGAQWTETILYSFQGGGSGQGGEDGAHPLAPPIWGSNGVLYGTTEGGGANNRGTIFCLTPPGLPGEPWTETVLHKFQGTNGAYPESQLTAGENGTLYGTTTGGGEYGNGTVFALHPPAQVGDPWTETVIYSFKGKFTDGADPIAGVVIGASEVIYGVTEQGGSGNKGTFFQLTPPTTQGATWTETFLHSFSESDGAFPISSLAVGPNGALYGTTPSGGAYAHGTVFQVNP